MDAQAEERVAAAYAVVLRRLAAVVDVHDGVLGRAAWPFSSLAGDRAAAAEAMPR